MAFRQQMQWLADNGYQTANLGYRTHHPKTIGIMFDDGYLDTYDNAWPILREYGFVATVFLISSLVGDAVQWKPQWKAAPLLDWRQVREMAQYGIQFGSHSHTHTDLTKMSEEQLSEDLRLSRQIIAGELHCAVKHFSFPSSQVSKVIARQVYASGFEFAFRFSPFYPGAHTRRYGVLPGTGILSYDDLDRFRHKVRGSFSRWFSWRIRQAKALAHHRQLPVF